MKILNITVMTHLPGTDEVYVDTDLPSPYPPSVDRSNLTMKFSVSAGAGVEYALRNFPETPITQLDMKTGKRSQAHR